MMVSLITEKLQSSTLSDMGWKTNSVIYQENIPIPTDNTHVIVVKDKKNCLTFLDGGNPTDRKKPQSQVPCSKHECSFLPGTRIALETPPACPHSPIPEQKCLLCAPQGSTNPPAPPKKRHCRSLSIPGDSPDTFAKWHGHSARLHKPVALRPHTNNNKHAKNLNRNSPVMNQARGSSLSLPGNILGAHVTCHGPIWTFSNNNNIVKHDRFHTPPESPIPRPASASGGYFDSTLSALNAPWLENATAANKFEAFKLRSLSVEDRVAEPSCRPQTSSVTGGSMPSVSANPGSTPSSPRRHRIPRCRSQPCVMHHDRRTCGVKRRLEEERPSLNFAKMTETAICINGGLNRARHKTINIPQSQLTKSSRACLSTKFDYLKPIASSPLDSNLPSSLSRTPTVTPPPTVRESDPTDETTTDPPKLTSRISPDTEDENCPCSVNGPMVATDDRDDAMFPMDHVNTEIDLNEMEND